MNEHVSPGESSASAAAWSPQRIAGERRRILSQLAIAGAIVGALIFSQFDYRYPVVRGASGTTYRIYGVGRVQDSRGGWSSVLQYLTAGRDTMLQNREVVDLMPLAAQIAASHGDSLVQVASIERPFRFGLVAPFTRRRIVFYVNRLGRWVRR